jgi:hypothetical protein
MISNASVPTARRSSLARITLSALLTSLIALSAVPAQTVAPATCRSATPCGSPPNRARPLSLPGSAPTRPTHG